MMLFDSEYAIYAEYLNAVTISMLIGSSSVNTQKFIMLI